MSSHAAQTAQQVTQGLTYGGGLVWLSTNSSAITVIAVVSTAIASIFFGMSNKRMQRRNTIANERNTKANEDRNKVNRRDIIEEIVSGLAQAGKSREYIEDLRDSIRK